MKIGAIKRVEFWARYKNIPFDIKDVVEFMREHEMLHFDEEAARKSHEYGMARQFASSFKDSNGAREFYAYTVNGKRKYRLVSNTKSTKILYGQKATLEKQVDGLSKGIKKIDNRIETVEQQQSLFKEEEISATLDPTGEQ